MIFSVTHLSLTAAAICLPIYVQAVAFTDDTFDGIALGQEKKLTWSGDDSPVTIKLMQGDPKALEPVVTVASGVAGGSYTWVPRTIVGGTYCLSITQGSETNYSPQFKIDGATPPGAPADKAASSAGPSVVPSKASGAKASHGPFLPSAVMAAYSYPYPSSGRPNGPPPDRYNISNSTGMSYMNGSDDITAGPLSCDDDMGWYPVSGAAGIGMKGVVCGAVVMVGVVLGMV